jgi:drug/metabolite transporter (DMT)-like permease
MEAWGIMLTSVSTRSPKISPYLFLILAPLFWAGNFVFGKPLLEALAPFAINLIRWLVACIVLVTLTLLFEGRFPRPARHQWLGLVAMSLTGVVLFNALVYLSLVYTTSTNAALINGATPVLTMILAAAVGLDRLTGRRLAGAFISLVGVVWIVVRGSLGALIGLSFNRGDLIMLVAALVWAIYTILLNRMTGTLSPLATLTIITVLALPPLAVIGGYELSTQPLGPITPVIGAGFLYIGVVASVAAFMAWSVGIRGVGAARGAIFVNLIPLFTAGIAVLTLGERLGLVQLIGGLLVIGGVTLASSRGWKRADDGPTMSPGTK